MEQPTHLDPRSPLVLDTHELGRRAGSMRQLQLTVPAPEDLGTDMIGIPAGSELELELRLESVMEGVLVTGSIRGRAVGECVRCLDEVVDDVDVPLTELYAYSERARIAEAEGDDLEGVRELDGDLIDFEPALRDAVVPALPFRPLCRRDCPGLCSECGAHLAEDPDHSHEILDPRWAALNRLQGTQDETKES
ncbi:YceD family protein [Pengzhenrongella phosphoraccumulans]|uniref:YceD family protein n=1 Tax=Pengzhenrongella phosphoraccumulans TaxID=3114394 RepID=UPI0038903C7A